MSTTNPYVWEKFHHELANKLLQYKNNRKELVSKVKSIYEIAKMKMPRLERDELVDIDPFTIFALFNRTPLTDSNRIKVMTALAKVFAISAPVPTSFKGVPFVYHMTATFYGFIGDRKEGDIDDLWSLFEAVLNYSRSRTQGNKEKVSDLITEVIKKKFNGTSKVTMALYWVSPDTYLSLDSKSQWYIYDSKQMSDEIVNSLPPFKGGSEKIKGPKYFEITERLQTFLQSGKCPFKNFKDLCTEAWRYAKVVNDGEEGKLRYWMYAPGEDAAYWDDFYSTQIMAIGWDYLGDLNKYSNRTEMQQSIKKNDNLKQEPRNQSLTTWQFVHDMKPGDIVFARKGRTQIIGRGIVGSDYEFDQDRKHYKNIRKVEWTHKGEWKNPDGLTTIKPLTDVTPYTEYIEHLNALFEIDVDRKSKAAPYDKEDFFNNVYMEEESYTSLVELIKDKKNVILQGPPGVGKTFAAKHLAYSIMEQSDDDRIEMIQFHQSYSYEDFIEGYRPDGSSFSLKKGAFYKFCKKAAEDPENNYFFIIDEINRGNMSKIFGELFMLIEKDKRERYSMPLMYGHEEFSVPQNIHIIGTMNTADRSLALLDYALRRRFAFFEMRPGFGTEGFKNYQKELNSKKFNSLIKCIDNLNEEISKDDSLGEGFCIGHSFFCNLEKDKVDQALPKIIKYEIIPLLKEYWFDEPQKVKDRSNELKAAMGETTN